MPKPANQNQNQNTFIMRTAEDEAYLEEQFQNVLVAQPDYADTIVDSENLTGMVKNRIWLNNRIDTLTERVNELHAFSPAAQAFLIDMLAVMRAINNA